MKKALFVLLALLIAGPAMAVPGTFTFGTPDTTSVSGQVTIPWTATAGVVGMSMKVNVTGGTASSVTVTPAAWFNVFMDSAFTIGETYTIGQGMSTASQTAPGQLALPSAAFSICVAGLDDDGVGTGTEEAPLTGSIVIVGTPSATIAITQDTLRGGIVGYDGPMTVATLPLNTAFGAPPTETISTPTVTKTTAAPAVADKVNGGRIETFVATGATSTVGHTLQYQFTWGDGVTGAWGTATQTHVYTYTAAGNYTVTVKARCAADTAIESAVSANFVVTREAVKSTATAMYSDWAAFGRPNCWAYSRNCHGDINGAGVGTSPLKKWVTSTDLTAFKAAYNLANSVLPAGGICADLNHAGVPTTYSSSQKRVTSTDLTIFKNYYNKYENDQLFPNTICDKTNYHFWTN